MDKRLSSLSTDKASFNQAALPYKKALDKCAQWYTLHYEPPTLDKRKTDNGTTYSGKAPHSAKTSATISYTFLTLVDKHFLKDQNLRKKLQPKYNQDQLQLHEQHQTDHRQSQQTHSKLFQTHRWYRRWHQHKRKQNLQLPIKEQLPS